MRCTSTITDFLNKSITFVTSTKIEKHYQQFEWLPYSLLTSCKASHHHSPLTLTRAMYQITNIFLLFILYELNPVCCSIIAIVDSSPSATFPSKRCLNAAVKLNDTVLFSWFENDQETTSWFESKDSDIIYIRSLGDSESPISRKSLFSWWPLRYSPRKRFQRQQFDLYFTGRSFHSVLPRKFTVNDATNLDQQILNRLFPVHRGITLYLRFRFQIPISISMHFTFYILYFVQFVVSQKLLFIVKRNGTTNDVVNILMLKHRPFPHRQSIQHHGGSVIMTVSITMSIRMFAVKSVFWTFPQNPCCPQHQCQFRKH